MFTNSKLRVIRDPASHPKFAELEDKLVRSSSSSSSSNHRKCD